MDVQVQKLAEKLTILNDRGVGLLTRLYNIKKACGDAKSKPGFLSEKTLESSIKHIIKRFPNIDIKQVQNIGHYRAEINKTLQLYYYTFVDLLDFKDHVSELFTIMDACQVELDITLNFDLTKGYLDLVVTFVTLMVLLSRVEDRKAVLGLFHVAHEMANNSPDSSFPRLGQMILEYDPPLKKLSDEFGPHNKLLVRALISLQNIYLRRNLDADTLRKKQMLSLTAQPGYLLIPARTDTTPCEYLSLDLMERWIIFGFLLCHHVLNSQQSPADEMWLSALRSSWVVTLFRDEVLHTHSYVIGFFDTIKGYNKRISEVKDAYTYAVQNAALMHRERRKFYRTALKEMALIMTDQPGLLGPKALYVFMGLCYARDEVVWLIRHHDNPPQHKGKSKATEDLTDRQLPELLFHMEELRALVRKYSQVIQRYYVQYLSCYDGPALGQLLPNFAKLETESMILGSIYNTISSLSVKQVEDNEIFDFRGLRLDWYRLQSFLAHSVGRIQGLSYLMNTTVFHLKLVDYQDELLLETSDLSLLCFYNRIFEDQFHMCLEFPAQNRYIVSFPLICSHFQNCTHEMCPEERHHIRERSLSVVNVFLEEMAKEAKNIITTICDEQCTLTDKLLPKHCASLIEQHLHRKKGKDTAKRKLLAEVCRPGIESFRKTREDLTTMDKLHMALTELCYAINYCPSISVWEYTFAPKEYLHQHLESRFAKALVGMVMYNAETNEIAKPSELLASVRTYMNVLQTAENYVHLDMTRVFNNVLLQQTQQQDSHGDKTVAALYQQWYTEILLRRVSTGIITFSPNQRAFVSLTAEGALPFSAEEFTDVTELRALAELIGPYGMKHMNETLMWQITSQLTELKKMVATNKETLMALRTNFDKPELMKELSRKLSNAENVLSRMTIIGMILRFQQLTQEAMHDVLIDRIPFLLSSILDFHEHAPNGESMNVAEMASAAGIPQKIDPTLVQTLRLQKNDGNEEEYALSCLLMVFVAVSIPKLARQDASVYRASLEAHSNNIHCLAAAVNSIFGALFTIYGQNDVEDRLKEFLALASSSLLRLGQEEEKEAVKNRESVYLLLDMIVQESPFLTYDLLESCFPFALIRNAFHAVYKQEHSQGM
ncbi:membrane-associated protein Hem [Folsomia candida]|uniref:Membrane-associated protein Hem n=1 Tax=Folsomia candida TaxID=158441 RepID=A0A226DHS4_FOLCA|nr:membrane-associated protein Hem [Folsomia candida]OXA44151.1 Membrane-associated protein Hem [Folsomia candida]